MNIGMFGFPSNSSRAGFWSVQVFESTGTFTPANGVTDYYVTCVGAGGGANGTAANYQPGHAGAVVFKKKASGVSGNVTVTVGTGGTTAGSPTAGGATSFGSYVTAAGGLAGEISGFADMYASWHQHPGPFGANGYGSGGVTSVPANGKDGVCIVEWFTAT